MSWLAGDVVVKPVDVGLEELAWQAQIISQIRWVSGWPGPGGLPTARCASMDGAPLSM